MKTIEQLIADADTLFNDIDQFHSADNFKNQSAMLREARGHISIALGRLNGHKTAAEKAAQDAAAPPPPTPAPAPTTAT